MLVVHLKIQVSSLGDLKFLPNLIVMRLKHTLSIGKVSGGKVERLWRAPERLGVSPPVCGCQANL